MNRVVGLLCTLVVLASANFAQENIVAVHPASTAPRCAHGKAVVQKPAPFFDADAVVNGEFKRVKLTDFQGMYKSSYLNWLLMGKLHSILLYNII